MTDLPPLFFDTDDGPTAADATRDLADPAPWRQAQADHAAVLAEAAFAVGQLDADLAAMSPDDRAGATRRLGLIEVEAILWADGRPLPREDIGIELLDAHASSDLEALRFSRWAMRRLEGRAETEQLRPFLGLHRVEASGEPTARRQTGRDFDLAAEAFWLGWQGGAGLHPLVRAPFARMIWRLADLSPAELGGEAAVWIARDMAQACPALGFVPLGVAHRNLWHDSGPIPDRVETHLRQVARGAASARQMLAQVAHWRAEASETVARIKGANPGRVIAVLAAHPLLSAASVADRAGISRITAERLLAKLQQMGLVREITGAKRFRLWTAQLARA